MILARRRPFRSNRMLFPTLSLEMKPNGSSLDIHMAISHRRQTIGVIFALIFLVLYVAFVAYRHCRAEAEIGKAAYLLNLTARQLADNTVYAAKTAMARAANVSIRLRS